MPNPTNKIVFTPEQHQYLRENYLNLSNKELADALGLKLTRLRNELRVLGLKRMKLQFWTDEQISFLKENFRRIGETEMVEIFTKKYPKEKGWNTSQLQKKMKQLGLIRNKLDLYMIKERNRKRGSFGNINFKNNPKPPKVYFQLDARTRIILNPNSNIEAIKEKYQRAN